MTDTPKSSTLLDRVQTRLRITSVARALYLSSLTVLAIAVVMILAIRLLGLFPLMGREPRWLLAIPFAAAFSALLFHRRVERQAAARRVDEHAKTNDLFLTLASITNSSGEYQPLVAAAAESQAETIAAGEVVPFEFGHEVRESHGLHHPRGGWALVPATTRSVRHRRSRHHRGTTTRQKSESIRKETLAEERPLEEAIKASGGESKEIDDMLSKLKKDFRKMQPKKAESNAKVLDVHRMDVGDKWKSANSDNNQLRQMMNQPISKQQLGGARNQKMNEWLKELQEGNTEQLREALSTAQKTMQAMAEAKDPEERKKLASQLQKELQDLNSFAKNKANSKELCQRFEQSHEGAGSIQAWKKRRRRREARTDRRRRKSVERGARTVRKRNGTGSSGRQGHEETGRRTGDSPESTAAEPGE